jgi:hypothetical protein
MAPLPLFLASCKACPALAASTDFLILHPQSQTKLLDDAMMNIILQQVGRWAGEKEQGREDAV